MENSKHKDQDNDMEEVTLQIAQLQAMVSELKTGLMGAIQDLSTFKMKDGTFEERVRSYFSDMDEKILGVKNTLNTFKEDLTAAVSQIKELNSKNKEMQRGLELFQVEVGTALISAQQRRGSKGDVQTDSLRCPLGQLEHSFLHHYLAGLLNGSSQRSSSSIPGTSNLEQELGSPLAQQGVSLSPVWEQHGDGKDATDGQGSQENAGTRRMAALGLLESERVYVSYLSVLLKANITFNDSEALHVKDKRPFPSSLRFLIQQHLELLHVLQERVLKCQWQGIMGDVFMRLTSTESDFLDHYVAYLKELPDCLSAASFYSTTSLKAAALFEGDITGDENHPPLQALLLLPVQRIPEYLILLQNLLKQTDSKHPDYYLLLVCIQKFRAFTGQYSHLLQCNEGLLTPNWKEPSRLATKLLIKAVDCVAQAEEPACPSGALPHYTSRAKRSKQMLLEQMQCKRFQDREAMQQCHESSQGPLPVLFFAPDADPRLKCSALQSIPETERECPNTDSIPCKRGVPGSALLDVTSQFLMTGGAPSLEGLFEDGESPHTAPFLDNCSSASSDSSVDIAFVRCPKSRGREPCAGRGSRDGGHKYPARGCVSPDQVGVSSHRPLQAVQRKSKSLNGLQLDSSIVANSCGSSVELTPPKSHSPQNCHQHAKLERQSSKGSTNRKLQRSINPLQKQEVDSRTTTEELCRDYDKDRGAQPPWAEESRWTSSTEESGQAAFSERNRRQEKGGFRSSFKKLFKKKSGSDSKDKGVEKSESQAYSDLEFTKTPRVAHPGDIDRGTAV